MKTTSGQPDYTKLPKTFLKRSRYHLKVNAGTTEAFEAQSSSDSEVWIYGPIRSGNSEIHLKKKSPRKIQKKTKSDFYSALEVVVLG